MALAILGHTVLARILALHFLDALKFSYFAAVVMIACNHRGGYFCPGHFNAWFWGCISYVGRLENVTGTCGALYSLK